MECSKPQQATRNREKPAIQRRTETDAPPWALRGKPGCDACASPFTRGWRLARCARRRAPRAPLPLRAGAHRWWLLAAVIGVAACGSSPTGPSQLEVQDVVVGTGSAAAAGDTLT